ncbi:MAG: ribulose-phosphate 3-epimerase [Spirochaetales bacterium]|uniref:Ribulose-phosphate 3-epimerase n=1 Tax=Candidatus Thalassospirochaeta sargassi TaxID=3119039 RepID=A0AAJ1IDM1_9SPIO|nr:ribulose-phosphate 3-epimerase [Spirochaetales bacterium]
MENKIISIAPSVLAADFVNMEQGIRKIEDASCEWIHLDIMDGSFVPPITFGHQMVKSIRNITDLILDAHLMIDNPGNQLDALAEAGADYVAVHLENTIHTDRIINRIKELGMKAGIAIVPSTPVSALSELLPVVDQVLVMTVNPGYGGQKMIPRCLDKIKQLDDIRKEYGYEYLISADGGINRETASAVRDAGIDVAVCGSSFFNAEDSPAEVRIIQGIE